MTRSYVPLSSLLPYSAISICIVLIVFQYSLFLDILIICSEYWEMSISQFLIYLCIFIVLTMFIIQGIINSVIYYYNNKEEEQNKERIYQQERQILLIIFEQLNGHDWVDKINWRSSYPLSSWKGVKINPHTNRIYKLILPDNNLKGIIPHEITLLTGLIELDFRRNQLTGVIPDNIGNLKLLQGLYLHDNYLQGRIPYQLSELTQLTGVYLFNNCFEDIKDTISLFEPKKNKGCIVYI